MAKQVFEITGYGTLVHRGEFIKETDQTVTFTRRYLEKPRRMFKTKGTVITEDNNPYETLTRYKAAFDSHKASVEEARQRFYHAQQEQGAAARRAAFPDIFPLDSAEGK